MSKNFRHAGEADKQPYHYTECGLDDIYLLSGYEDVNSDHGQGTSVKHADELHDAIGCFLVTEKKVLSGKELRFLRKEMDLTQAELGKFVGLSDQQVARWEKDEYAIPNSADYLLRVLYLQQRGKKFDVRELLTSLEETDAGPKEERHFFEPTKNGWRPKLAA